eukprot:GHVN01095769.1.p1 GENE.GHVN01095769.1~~GHVN01095769.1.p1  ORF type:complete len:123 (+),score=12.85 GHVN01095769.1:62-430(+)
MPGAKIPEPFRWDDSFKVFYEQLDKEHQGLFDGIFECCGARDDKGKFDNLYKLVDVHFKSEEALMETNKYPDFKSHQQTHNEFLGKLKGVSLPLDDATANFAKSWLVNHIMDLDFKYKGKLG